MERSQKSLLVQQTVFEHLLVVYVPKPKLRALQQQDISILKSARKKTQPAAKMVIQVIHIVLIVRKQFHMVKPLKKPATILGMTERLQPNLPVQNQVKKLIPVQSARR